MMNINIPFKDLLPVGVCSFSDISEFLIDCRAKARIPEGAKSVIVYLVPYFLGEENYIDLNISRYAVPPDYHTVVNKYLDEAVKELKKAFGEYDFQSFCDNSPVPEVRAAALAGLGLIGENGLLINEKYGSYVFIGEIVTDMEITPCENREVLNCPGCGKCKSACPSGALTEEFCKEKCLSHITQKKGELSEEEKLLIKANGCIWGCDKCQEACFLNKSVSITPIKEFIENAVSNFKEGDSLESRAFSWRGRQVIERNFKIMCCKE